MCVVHAEFRPMTPQLDRTSIEEGDFPITVYGVDCCRQGLQEIDEFVVSTEAGVTPQCTAMILARRYDFVAHCTPPIGISPMKSCLPKDGPTSSCKELVA